MNKKALFALPLMLVSLASCDVNDKIQWCEDAKSIYVYEAFNQYGTTSGMKFTEREYLNNDGSYLIDNDIWYRMTDDGIYIKKKNTRYKTYDYDEETKIFSNKKDVLSNHVDIYKYVGLPYRIIYKG